MPKRFLVSRGAKLLVAAATRLAMSALPAHAAGEPASERWEGIRTLLFQTRPISTAPGDTVKLFMPDRAEDAAVVPILIRTGLDQTPQRYIKNVYLIIDNNPSPISATFHLTPESGRADIETRVRVESFTPVRAIAETSDGELFMATKTILASGGCSAPAPKSAAEMANVGRMKFRLDDERVEFDRPALAQVMINHPNWSGLGSNAPEAQFIKQVSVFYGDRLVMSADVDFSISENPNFRFYFLPRDAGELKVEMVDTAELRYVSSLRLGRSGRPEGTTALGKQ